MNTRTTSPRKVAKPTPQKKTQLKAAVKLTVKQYRKTLELLAKT